MPESSNNVATILTGKTDAQRAEEYRAELLPLLQQVCEVLDRSRRDGLVVSFSLAPDQYGRQTSGPIGVVRPL